MSVLHLDSTNFDAEISGELPVLVDFWATWCGPCRMIAPYVEELAEEYEGRIKVAKVDVDRDGEIAVRYGINSIPALFIFKDGKPVDKLVGAMPKSALKNYIEKNL